MMRKLLKQRWKQLGLLLLAIVILSVIYMAIPGKVTYTVNRTTMEIDSPIDADGLIDYRQSLNDLLADEVTPEQNAVVLLWEAIGQPKETINPEYFSKLGIPTPQTTATSFIGYEAFCQQVLPAEVFAKERQNQLYESQLEFATDYLWQPSPKNRLADWLKRNEAVLNKVQQTSLRLKWYSPVTAKYAQTREHLAEGNDPIVTHFAPIYQMLCCRLMMLLETNQQATAWRDILTLYRLARLLSNAPSLSVHSVAATIENRAIQMTDYFLKRFTMTHEQLSLYFQDVNSLPVWIPYQSVFEYSERYRQLDGIQNFTRHRMSSHKIDLIKHHILHHHDTLFARHVQLDEGLQHIAATHQQLTQAMKEPLLRQQWQALERIEDTRSREARELSRFAMFKPGHAQKRGLAFVHWLQLTFKTNLKKVMPSEYTLVARRRMLPVVFALKHYQIDHQQFPKNLEELAPRYLEQIPNDPFTNQPLNYQLNETGFTLQAEGIEFDRQPDNELEPNKTKCIFGDEIQNCAIPWIDPNDKD